MLLTSMNVGQNSICKDCKKKIYKKMNVFIFFKS